MTLPTQYKLRDKFSLDARSVCLGCDREGWIKIGGECECGPYLRAFADLLDNHTCDECGDLFEEGIHTGAASFCMMACAERGTM